MKTNPHNNNIHLIPNRPRYVLPRQHHNPITIAIVVATALVVALAGTLAVLVAVNL